MAPAVTIGLPFRNEATWLPLAVRSMLRQSFSDFELLLLDDGSTDDSLAVARAFDDPRITVLSDGQRRHLPARLNEITKRARGRFIARMDGDDISHPERLEKELRLLERTPSCDAVGTLAAVISDDGRPHGIVGDVALPASRAFALERGLLVHPTMLARRELYLANPYDEAMTRSEDRDLWCRTAESVQYAIIREPLHLLRISGTSPSFLPGYLLSHRQNRALFLRYGPEVAGLAATARMWLASYTKSLVMRGATRIGAAPLTVRRRGRPLTDTEERMVAEATRAVSV